MTQARALRQAETEARILADEQRAAKLEEDLRKYLYLRQRLTQKQQQMYTEEKRLHDLYAYLARHGTAQEMQYVFKKVPNCRMFVASDVLCAGV